jgi:hypothetical protein
MIRKLRWAACLVALGAGSFFANSDSGAEEPKLRLPNLGIFRPQPKPATDPLLRVSGVQEDQAEKIGAPSKAEPPKHLVAESTAHEPCVYGYADYLLWWIRQGPTPVLLTTGPDDGIKGGVLGVPGTRVLFDSNNLDFGTISGVRAGAGWNFGEDRFWGIELSGFLLPENRISFTRSSNADGVPLLVRPFLSVDDATESGLEVAGKALDENDVLVPSLQGRINIDASTRFWGWEANIVAHSVRDTNRRFDLLGGFRALGLDEELCIQENLLTRKDGALTFQTDPGVVASEIDPPPGSTVRVVDEFSTRNRFYGGQLGGRFQWLWDRWQVDLTGKIAFGVTHQQSTIFGQSVLNNAIVSPGGMLALGTDKIKANIGELSRDQFAVVPEIGIHVHRDITSRIRASVGYGGIYWSAVARPGDQIDRNLNPKLIPTGRNTTATDFNPETDQVRPRAGLRDNGFWAHGANFRIEFRY